jgi:SAM-dependent methyltransferase
MDERIDALVKSWPRRPPTISQTNKKALANWVGYQAARLARKPGWHRLFLGGDWDKMQALQFAFLKKHGLDPKHKVLEVGCGALRLGARLAKVLAPGNYYGFDSDAALMNVGALQEMKQVGAQDVPVTLWQTDTFDLSCLPDDLLFDRAFAYSIFTHLTPRQIGACIAAVVPRLAPEGVFFATFNEDIHGRLCFGKPYPLMTRYPKVFMAELGGLCGAFVEYIGPWDCPYHENGKQMMLAIRPQS